jgi:hypothetical protein
MTYESLAAPTRAGRLDKIVAMRKQHSPEQIVRKLTMADRLLAEGKDTARRYAAGSVCPRQPITAGATSSALASSGPAAIGAYVCSRSEISPACIRRPEIRLRARRWLTTSRSRSN